MPRDDASLPRITVAEIQRAVCERFGVRMIDMGSHRRARSVARPRQVAMYLARELTPLSLPMIGRHFGDRDHTTVMHACQTIGKLVAQDDAAAAVVAVMRQELTEPDQLTLPQITRWQVIAAQFSRLVA